VAESDSDYAREKERYKETSKIEYKSLETEKGGESHGRET
jgi:hypothetical protein